MKTIKVSQEFVVHYAWSGIGTERFPMNKRNSKFCDWMHNTGPDAEGEPTDFTDAFLFTAEDGPGVYLWASEYPEEGYWKMPCQRFMVGTKYLLSAKNEYHKSFISKKTPSTYNGYKSPAEAVSVKVVRNNGKWFFDVTFVMADYDKGESAAAKGGE